MIESGRQPLPWCQPRTQQGPLREAAGSVPPKSASSLECYYYREKPHLYVRVKWLEERQDLTLLQWSGMLGALKTRHNRAQKRKGERVTDWDWEVGRSQPMSERQRHPTHCKGPWGRGAEWGSAAISAFAWPLWLVQGLRLVTEQKAGRTLTRQSCPTAPLPSAMLWPS